MENELNVYRALQRAGATYNRLPAQNKLGINQMTPGKPGHFEFKKNLDLRAPIRYKQFRQICCLHS